MRGTGMTTISKRKAEALWVSMGEALTDFEAALGEVIEARAWEPLGYQSFFEAWADRMAGYRLSSMIGKATVVYQMLDEGIAVNEIAMSAPGLGPAQVAKLAQKKANSVPTSHATTGERPTVTKRRECWVNSPTEARTLHIKPSKQDYDKFCKIALELGISNESLGKEAVRIVVDRGGIN